jgi:hypothetical protein
MRSSRTRTTFAPKRCGNAGVPSNIPGQEILELGSEERRRRSIVDPAVIGVVVFACTFGGVLRGMKLRTILPEQHLSGAFADTIR